MMKLQVFFLAALLSVGALAQNLLDERIRRLTPNKKSIFLERGIFHNGGPKTATDLRAIRHNFSKNNGFERVVFDFTTDEIPRIYGYISMKEKKLYIDFFKTSVKPDLGSFGDSKFIKSVNFFPIQKDTLSVEVLFKDDVSIDVFYLKKPGRFVVDIKS